MNYFEALQPLDRWNQILQSNVHPLDWQNPTPEGKYHLVVIGAGTAGLVTAAGAAGLGAKVALIERGLMGGDCLNTGCVPSKAMIAASRRMAAISESSPFGIRASIDEFDFAAMMERIRQLRAGISPHDSARRFRELGVDVYFGSGQFIREGEIDVAGTTLKYRRAVIATGGRAAELAIPGLKEVGYLTNDTLFTLTELPKKLLILGGGPIGLEMAQCFCRFGSQVTVVEQNHNVLQRDDSDASQVVQETLQREGVTFCLASQVKSIEIRDNQKMALVQFQSTEQWHPFDAILLASGRRANVEDLGLEKIGIKYDIARGVEVNDYLQTTHPHVYAAGDVCSQYKFTHAADFMARIVIRNALFWGRSKASRLLIPRCTYTNPELAQVGLTVAEAKQRNLEITSFKLNFSEVDRAILENETTGFIQIHCRKGSDQIVGATIVGAQAGDMISEIAVAMKNKIGLRKLAEVIHPYPTTADAIRRLGDQYNRTRLTPTVKKLFQLWLGFMR